MRDPGQPQRLPGASIAAAGIALAVIRIRLQLRVARQRRADVGRVHGDHDAFVYIAGFPILFFELVARSITYPLIFFAAA